MHAGGGAGTTPGNRAARGWRGIAVSVAAPWHRTARRPTPIPAIHPRQGRGFAEQLWSGRDGPPYFHKVRRRPALDAAAAGEAAAARAFLEEALQQNWRAELDYGLGGKVPEAEALLVVCSPAAAAQLLRAALGGEHAPPPPGSVAAVGVGGTEAGAAADWASLPRTLVLGGWAPAAGEVLQLPGLL
jgi:hypothetical protein